MQLPPDEAVCTGATFYAAMLSGQISVDDFAFQDVIPLNLGTDVDDDGVSVIIPKGTQFPFKKSKSYLTTENNQTFFSIQVLQGDSPRASQCHLIANLQIEGIPPGAAGSQRCRITYSVDRNGILKVTAQSTTDKTNIIELFINAESLGLGDVEVNKLAGIAARERQQADEK